MLIAEFLIENLFVSLKQDKNIVKKYTYQINIYLFSLLPEIATDGVKCRKALHLPHQLTVSAE